MLFGAAAFLPKESQHDEQRDQEILKLIARGSVPAAMDGRKREQRAVENALWLLNQCTSFAESEASLAQDDLRRVANLLCAQRSELHPVDLEQLSVIATKYAEMANSCSHPFHRRQIRSIATKLRDIVEGKDCVSSISGKYKKSGRWYARLWRNAP